MQISIEDSEKYQTGMQLQNIEGLSAQTWKYTYLMLSTLPTPPPLSWL